LSYSWAFVTGFHIGVLQICDRELALSGSHRQSAQTCGFRLSSHEVGVLQRLSGRALAQVVDGAKRDDEAGASIDRVGKKSEVGSCSPAGVRTSAGLHSRQPDERLVRIERSGGVMQLL